MRMTMDASVLRNAIAAGVAPSRNSNPATLHALMEYQDGELIITTTDLRTTKVVHVPCQADSENDATYLPDEEIGTLNDEIQSLKNKVVELTMQQDAA